jgi:hypothetical protein
MTFALKQQNVNTLTETLLKVSDPKHTDYGKHLTKGEVDSLVAPSDKTVRHAVPSFTRSSRRVSALIHSLAAHFGQDGQCALIASILAPSGQ